MQCACDLGLRMGLVPAASRKTLAALCEKLPRISLPSRPDAHRLYKAMFTDKKMRDGKLAFVLPVGSGKSKMIRDVPEKAVMETLRRVLGCDE
jgi:shikimate kinase/3-dehydroquinate synthase